MIHRLRTSIVTCNIAKSAAEYLTVVVRMMMGETVSVPR
jgi:hypothetical protein